MDPLAESIQILAMDIQIYSHSNPPREPPGFSFDRTLDFPNQGAESSQCDITVPHDQLTFSPQVVIGKVQVKWPAFVHRLLHSVDQAVQVDEFLTETFYAVIRISDTF